MKIIPLVILALLVVGILYYGGSMYQKFRVSQSLVQRAEPFTRTGETASTTLLVLGDSTAVGVGADRPEDTLGARLATAIDAEYVENQARSGAVTADLDAQIDGASRTQYDYVLVQIGANDIIRFRSADTVARQLAAALAQLPEHDHLIVLTAGNVGAAPFFPSFMGPFYTKRNKEYQEQFALVVREAGGTYVDLYEPPDEDVFAQQPDVYLAADGLHPSSKGYERWFEAVAAHLGDQ